MYPLSYHSFCFSSPSIKNQGAKTPLFRGNRERGQFLDKLVSDLLSSPIEEWPELLDILFRHPNSTIQEAQPIEQAALILVLYNRLPEENKTDFHEVVMAWSKNNHEYFEDLKKRIANPPEWLESLPGFTLFFPQEL